MPCPRPNDTQIGSAERAPLVEIAAEAHRNGPFPPFRVIGNIDYVGTSGISSWLITTPRGHILIDGALPQSPPQILANIRSLGFDIHDVKYLLNSHAHFDHAGGLAVLKRESSPYAARTHTRLYRLEHGCPRRRRGCAPCAPISFWRRTQIFFDLQAKRARQIAGDANAFVDPGELQGFNAQSERDFEAELAKERAAAAPQSKSS